MTAPLTPQRPIENVGRGALLSLLALPVGVVLWTLIASIGFIASIVSFVVAFLAVWLYRRGSGGIISRPGAWIVTGVVAVTLFLSFFAVMVVGSVDGLAHASLLTDSRFWPIFWSQFPQIFQADLPSIGLGLLFGALGCYRILGRAFSTARATSSTTSTFGTAPAIPTAPYVPQSDAVSASAPAPTEAQLNPESTGTISSAPDDRTPPPTPRD